MRYPLVADGHLAAFGGSALTDPAIAVYELVAARPAADTAVLAYVGAYRGRTLLPQDEHAGAPDAIVIGHDEWVRRFGADPDIVGQSVDR